MTSTPEHPGADPGRTGRRRPGPVAVPGPDGCGGTPDLHERRLVAVHLEEGRSVREHGCPRCGAVWFS